MFKINLTGLECPHTWGSDYSSLQRCADTLDKLCLSATPWTDFIDRYKLSWSLWVNSKHDEAHHLVVECYMRQLPHPVFHQHCALIEEYRRALRIVLDSQWAVMQMPRVLDTTAVGHLAEFIAAVEPLTQLDSKQRSAVYAIRGYLAPPREDLKWLRKAVDLGAGEGEWCYLLGWLLQESRRSKGMPSVEEMSMLRDAYRLRKNPDTVLRLARSLIECGPVKYPEAEELVQEALRLYPDHPRALTNGANMLVMLRGSGPRSIRRMRRMFLRAQDIVGERAFIHLKLGTLCFMAGDPKQGESHFDAAKRLNPGSCQQFADTCDRIKAR